MQLTGILETALYVEDLPRARDFFQRLFGLEILMEDERICAMSVAGRDVLLLFKQGASLQPTRLPGGTIPPHDGSGPQHLAFSIPAADLPAWERKLQAEGVAIVDRVQWHRGGVSIYFRDPDGHVLELATPGVWAIY